MTKYSSSAKVVDGSLVLSLPDAVTPVVMRLSLEEVSSAAFTVIEKKDQHILTVQFSDTQSRDIAPFAEKEQAVSALMAASAALEKGSKGGLIGANDNTGGNLPAKAIAKWAAALGVLIFLFWMVGLMSQGVPRAPLPASMSQSQPAGTPAPTLSGNTARQKTGVAVSADDFLSRGN